MKRLLYGAALALVLTGIVHIVIILLIPSYAERDAWATLAGKGKAWEFSQIAGPDKARRC